MICLNHVVSLCLKHDTYMYSRAGVILTDTTSRMSDTQFCQSLAKFDRLSLQPYTSESGNSTCTIYNNTVKTKWLIKKQGVNVKLACLMVERKHKVLGWYTLLLRDHVSIICDL